MQHLKYHFRRTPKGNIVGVNGIPLVGDEPVRLVFEWGEVSDGVRILAQCVLDHYFKVKSGEPHLAIRHYDDFTNDFFCQQKADSWILDSTQIQTWLIMRMH